MKKNIIANVFGRLWGLLSAFLFIPLYIKFLGFESYSVISFTLVLAGIMAILDSGLTATLSREFARKDGTDESKLRTYKTLETVYIGLVLLCIAIVVLFSGVISKSINVKSFSQEQVQFFLKIVSVDIGFQLLFRFYMGGLLGLEQQVKANVYQVCWGVMRNAAAVLIIYYFPSLTYFFIWQSAVTVLFTVLIKFALDSQMFQGRIFNLKLKFEKEVFREIWKFAGGMMLISLIAALNTQMDKLTISKLLSIESLGYYTLAVSLSSVLVVVVNPIATAILPQLTSLYSHKLSTEAQTLFNRFNILASILVATILAVLVFFPKEILFVWTGNKNLSEHAKVLVPLIAMAYGCVALQVVPYHVAIANGYTKLNNILGFVSLFITFPGYIFGIKNYGAVGGAAVFFGVQLISLIVYVYFINRKFFGTHFFAQFFLRHLIFPLVVAMSVGFGLSYFTNNLSDNRFVLLGIIVFSGVCILIAVALTNIPKSEFAIFKNFKNLIKS